MKDNQKHLTLSQRIIIEQGLNEGLTFTAIAKKINKDPSTVSKEVRRHRTLKERKNKHLPPRCKLEKSCSVTGLCKGCRSKCNECNKCLSICKDYQPKSCGRTDKPPYVCNACRSLVSCHYFRYIYVAKYADDVYHELLSSSREGINQSAESMQTIDSLISPLLLKGQSLSHIYSNHAEELADLNCKRRTVYRYLDQNLFTAKNIDLPRKVKYKKRKASVKIQTTNPNYRIGHTYNDFIQYIQQNPDMPIVEMDTVEGCKGGKVLLTLLFRNCNLMLILLLRDKTQQSVIEAFDQLSKSIGVRRFKKLFSVILTDNGTEFQNRERLEQNAKLTKRCKIFYCDPNCSWQKGMIEKNHEYIRYIVPKGKSFDKYTQEDIDLIMNHINSTARDSLNGCTPYKLSRLLLDNHLHDALSLQEIAPDDVTLKPILLKK